MFIVGSAVLYSDVLKNSTIGFRDLCEPTKHY